MTTRDPSDGTPLNVLILEDQRSDVELLRYQLRQEGFTISATCVTSEPEFIAHLSPDVDVILADYTLPTMDALRALECLQATGLDIPLIVVSGTVGEETALAAMRLGAADYILKDRLLRLGAAIREALEKKGLRRAKREADQAICDREKRFRALIEYSTDGILLLAADGTIQYASPSAARILHLPIEAIVGKSALSFVSGKAAGTFARRFRRLVRQRDRIVTAEFRYHRENDRDLWLQVTIRTLLHEPAVAGIVVNFRDITLRIDHERQLVLRAQQLIAKNEHLARNSRRLEELNAAAHENLANVSHDFRTPLTVLGEYCSLLREGHGGPLSQEQQRMTAVMAMRIDDLALMVENMLDSSTSEAGIMLTFRRVCALSGLCETLTSLLERRAANKGVSLQIQVPENLPGVFCDPEKLQRVVVNLAVNAVKFTPPGGLVRLWIRDDAPGRQVIFGVTDNGPGIPPKDLQVIFDRFRKLENSSDHSGFGLGLNITSEFVRLNLGAMNVMSQAGAGATFSFSIPYAIPSVVFGRFLDFLRSGSEPPRFVSLMVVSLNEELARGRKADLEHLLSLRLHSNEVAFPCGETAWCTAVPLDEGEAAEFAGRLQTEWGHLRKNCPARTLPDLVVNSRGSWKFPDDRARMESEFCALASCAEAMVDSCRDRLIPVSS